MMMCILYIGESVHVIFHCGLDFLLLTGTVPLRIVYSLPNTCFVMFGEVRIVKINAE